MDERPDRLTDCSLAASLPEAKGLTPDIADTFKMQRSGVRLSGDSPGGVILLQIRTRSSGVIRKSLMGLVGVRGFEPPAPASRRQYSTRLSYTPNARNDTQSNDATKGQSHCAFSLSGGATAAISAYERRFIESSAILISACLKGDSCTCANEAIAASAASRALSAVYCKAPVDLIMAVIRSS